jgi:hypothetical protein
MPQRTWGSLMVKHSEPYLATCRWWTYAACGCGWERWFRCGPSGAAVGWALHVGGT